MTNDAPDLPAPTLAAVLEDAREAVRDVVKLRERFGDLEDVSDAEELETMGGAANALEALTAVVGDLETDALAMLRELDGLRVRVASGGAVTGEQIRAARSRVVRLVRETFDPLEAAATVDVDDTAATS